MNSRIVRMELDTGVAVSVMSAAMFERVGKSSKKLGKSKLRLKTYTGELVIPDGVGEVIVAYNGQ